jgi:hypothetical protein
LIRIFNLVRQWNNVKLYPQSRYLLTSQKTLLWLVSKYFWVKAYFLKAAIDPSAIKVGLVRTAAARFPISR